MLELNGHTAGVEKIDESSARITIVIGPEDFEKGLLHAYNASKGRIDLPGFRKGKVPRNVVEAQLGKEVFYEEAINHLLPEAYEKAVAEHGLDVVSNPDIEVLEASPAGAAVAAKVILKPTGSIADYKGIKYVPMAVDVSDADIDEFVKAEREKNARFVPVERPVADGDIVRIDFEGFTDGVAFQGGKGENHELIIGSETFIPGFEAGVIGMSVGESRDINVTFPEVYHNLDLAGKEAVFKVVLNSCHEKELPDADDEFAQSVSDFDTLDEYLKEVRGALTADKETAAKQAKEDAVFEELAKKVVVDVPEAMIDSEVNLAVNRFARGLMAQGMHFDRYLQFMGLTVDDLKRDYREGSERNVRARLALEAIVLAEGIDATQDEIDAEIGTFVKGPDAVQEWKDTMSPIELRGLEMDVRNQKAMAMVLEHAVAVADKPAGKKGADKSDTED